MPDERANISGFQSGEAGDSNSAFGQLAASPPSHTPQKKLRGETYQLTAISYTQIH
jgi:hypothetical protein